jgi:hypothetical protein
VHYEIPLQGCSHLGGWGRNIDFRRGKGTGQLKTKNRGFTHNVSSSEHCSVRFSGCSSRHGSGWAWALRSPESRSGVLWGHQPVRHVGLSPLYDMTCEHAVVAQTWEVFPQTGTNVNGFH